MHQIRRKSSQTKNNNNNGKKSKHHLLDFQITISTTKGIIIHQNRTFTKRKKQFLIIDKMANINKRNQHSLSKY